MFFDNAIVYEILELNSLKKEKDSFDQEYCKTQAIFGISNSFQCVAWVFIATQFTTEIIIEVYKTDKEDDWMSDHELVAEVPIKPSFDGDLNKPSIVWIEANSSICEGHYFKIKTDEPNASVICMTWLGGPQMCPVDCSYITDSMDTEYIELKEFTEQKPLKTAPLNDGPTHVVTANAMG